ncbi:LysM domain/BON superfamily protein [Geobacter sp. OR-1]|uniref:LysM peptidoglycan-binding domain-containing protein n=1 Tax=Geobacter sp. OR-1 TaxID=1266765 RepID=UPI000541F470|nr:LysM peptidoglycan-binding domain-containing protein [Geobacter sp. OR-1]GAM09767.1 LysM domain/BON superfamily protein [Geobacter sp. OR-1]
MKKAIFTVLAAAILSYALPVLAGSAEPQTYVIQQGDTLWGLSEKFLNDPHYWPDLWAKNPVVTNPHVIFPGQKILFRNGKIEIAPAPAPEATEQPAAAPVAAKPVEQRVKEITFSVTGGEGFIEEGEHRPFGTIISTYQNRQLSGEDDIVYTDLGRTRGAKVGDRFSIYQKSGAISHPLTNMIAGYKVIPLGTLQLAELEDKVSKAIITESYQEIGPGAQLAPYKERKKAIPLKAADLDLSGYIIETKTGNKAIATGEIAYLDLGESHGIRTGNMVYVVRDVQPDPKFIDVPVGKLPPEVIGALVVVDTNKTTSTALVIKSIDTIYRADRVELLKGR